MNVAHLLKCQPEGRAYITSLGACWLVGTISMLSLTLASMHLLFSFPFFLYYLYTPPLSCSIWQVFCFIRFLVGTIFMLSPIMLQSSSIIQRGAFIHVWCPGFNGCHPGDIPLSPGSGGQGGLQSWVLWDSLTIKKPILGRLPLIGHCTDSRLKRALFL